MIDLVFPNYNPEYIDNVFSHMSQSELCSEYIVTKKCFDLLVNDDCDSMLREYADYMLAVIREEMSLRYVRLTESNLESKS